MTRALLTSLGSPHTTPPCFLCSILMHFLPVPPARQTHSHLRAFAWAVLSAWKALSPRCPHICLLFIIQIVSPRTLSLTLSTLTPHLQHLARCTAQSNPGYVSAEGMWKREKVRTLTAAGWRTRRVALWFPDSPSSLPWAP